MEFEFDENQAEQIQGKLAADKVETQHEDNDQQSPPKEEGDHHLMPEESEHMNDDPDEQNDI